MIIFVYTHDSRGATCQFGILQNVTFLVILREITIKIGIRKQGIRRYIMRIKDSNTAMMKIDGHGEYHDDFWFLSVNVMRIFLKSRCSEMRFPRFQSKKFGCPWNQFLGSFQQRLFHFKILKSICSEMRFPRFQSNKFERPLRNFS